MACIRRKPHEEQCGLCTVELLWSVMIGAIVLTSLLTFTMENLRHAKQMQEYLDCYLCQRFVRQVAVERLKRCHGISIHSNHKGFKTWFLNQDKAPTWRIEYINGRIYRTLRDNSKQPFMGMMNTEAMRKTRIRLPKNEMVWQDGALICLQWEAYLTGDKRETTIEKVHVARYPGCLLYESIKAEEDRARQKREGGLVDEVVDSEEEAATVRLLTEYD